MPDYCLEHPNTELVPAEDTGDPTCWVCTTLRVADLVDSWAVVGPDGQDRTVSKEEFIRGVLESA